MTYTRSIPVRIIAILSDSSFVFPDFSPNALAQTLHIQHSCYVAIKVYKPNAIIIDPKTLKIIDVKRLKVNINNTTIITNITSNFSEFDVISINGCIVCCCTSSTILSRGCDKKGIF